MKHQNLLLKALTVLQAETFDPETIDRELGWRYWHEHYAGVPAPCGLES
jgi:hypothetical protein